MNAGRIEQVRLCILLTHFEQMASSAVLATVCETWKPHSLHSKFCA